MIRNIISILSIILLLASCSQEVFIDNPTLEPLKVVVKGKEIQIDAKSFQIIKVSKGINSIIVISNFGDTLLNENIDIYEDGVLNVTKSDYAIWRDVFCEEADYEDFKTTLNLKDTVLIDGLEFVDIDLELFNDIFIAKKWDVGLNNSMPKTIDLKNNEVFRVVSKIYRAKELKNTFNYYGDYDFKDLTEEEINKILNDGEDN